MNKYLVVFFSLAYLTNNLGFTMEEAKQQSLPTSNYITNAEMAEVLPAVKSCAREYLVSRFTYASDKLLEIVKDSKYVSGIINIELLGKELRSRAEMLRHNQLEGFDSPFTEITLPLLTKKSSALIEVQSFVIWNYSLREISLLIPFNYDKKYPTLDFVADLTLCYRMSAQTPKLTLKEETLATIMSGIEADLITAPNVRSEAVTANTRLVFEFFKKCKNYDDDPVKKITAYQKYLNQEQNSTLTLQLLSVYLNKPSIYDFGNYMILLAQQLFLNIRARNIAPLIDSNHHSLISVLQKYLSVETQIESEDKNINNFANKVMNTAISNKTVISLGQQGQCYLDTINGNYTKVFKELCSKRITTRLQIPLINRFLQLNKKMKDENIYETATPQFKRFVATMCNGCSGVLIYILNHLDFKKIVGMYKIMGIRMK